MSRGVIKNESGNCKSCRGGQIDSSSTCIAQIHKAIIIGHALIPNITYAMIGITSSDFCIIPDFDGVKLTTKVDELRSTVRYKRSIEYINHVFSLESFGCTKVNNPQIIRYARHFSEFISD